MYRNILSRRLLRKEAEKMNRLTTEHDIAPRYLGVRQVLIDAALAYVLGCDYKRVLQIGSYGT